MYFIGLHLKLGAGIVTAVAFYYVKQYRTAYLADKDAMFRHYIQLHPEHFPPPGLYINIAIRSSRIFVIPLVIYRARMFMTAYFFHATRSILEYDINLICVI